MLVLALSVACTAKPENNGKSTPNTNNETKNNSETGKEESKTDVSTAEIQPVKGGRLKISAATPTTRAWYDIRGIMAVAMFGMIYEPLARYGSDGAPEPFLAESITPDAEALTWTIVLRDGIKFSDGSDCDADAVAWNLDFYKANGVLTASFFKYYDHAEVKDAKTVVCHFTQWDALFDYSLCRTVLIASKKAFDEHGQDWLCENPVGTGPFVQAEFNADTSWYLDRNENYWQGEVYLDGLDLITYQQELVAATSLNAGEIDALLTENYPFELSGGMRQRVLIAISVACNSKLIVADEPTTALDVTIQAQVMELLQNLVEEKKTSLIIVTHNLGLVTRHTKRIYVMYAGRIIESGTTEEIITKPKHPYTMGLLNSVPKLEENDDAELIPIDGAPPSLVDLPDQCAFLPRCPYACDKCRQNPYPALRQTDGNEHYIACHFDLGGNVK